MDGRLIPCSRNTFRLKIHFLDGVCAVISPWIAFALREPLLFTTYLNDAIAYAVIGFAATVSAVAFSPLGHVLPEYFSRRDIVATVKVASASIVITVILMFSMTRLVNIPRSLPAIHLFILLAVMVGWRWVRSSLAHQRKIGDAQAPNRWAEYILIIGANSWTWWYSGMMIEVMTQGRQKIVAILDDNARLLGRSIHGHRVIGEIRDIERVVDEYGVHGISIRRVVLTGPKENLLKGSWTHLDRVCSARGIALEVLAEKLGLVDVDEGSTVDTRCTPDCPLTAELAMIRARPYWRVKRAFDVILAGLLLVVLTPLFLLNFIAVLLDIGRPTIFWQRRVGRDRKPIFVYKFRTLRAPFQRDGVPIPQASRLTSIGRFMRETRLDELPQLISVLRGDMSIIGPRPLMPTDLPDDAELRLAIKPGLTGWAQVHGGNLIMPSEKNALDEWYIRNASLWVDIKIFAKTLTTVVRGDRRADDVLVHAMKAGVSRHAPAAQPPPA